MTRLRVLFGPGVQSAPDAALNAHAQAVRARPGCVEAEWYRSVEDDSRLTHVQLWEGHDSIDDYLKHADEPGGAQGFAGPLAGNASSPDRAEIYRHEYFDLEGSWRARSVPPGCRIKWPIPGRVRIAIQGSRAELDDSLQGLVADMAATQAEPGCEEYEWFRGVEHPHHVLLLELWSSQALYDAHWRLRDETATERKPPLTGAAQVREQGSNGAEFYAHQEFIELYRRWVPADSQHWSGAVTWGC